MGSSLLLSVRARPSPAAMSTLHYTTPIPRSSAWLERLVLVVGLCLPVPLLAVTGLSLPIPAAVERIAAALVPWADDGSVEQAGDGSKQGAIVLAPGEPAAATAAVAGVRQTLVNASGGSPRRAGAHRRRADTVQRTTSHRSSRAHSGSRRRNGPGAHDGRCGNRARERRDRRVGRRAAPHRHPPRHRRRGPCRPRPPSSRAPRRSGPRRLHRRRRRPSPAIPSPRRSRRW